MPEKPSPWQALGPGLLKVLPPRQVSARFIVGRLYQTPFLMRRLIETAYNFAPARVKERRVSRPPHFFRFRPAFDVRCWMLGGLLAR
jgi:hypothetical protein